MEEFGQSMFDEDKALIDLSLDAIAIHTFDMCMCVDCV